MTERISELLNILRDEDNCNVLDYVDDAADLIESLAAELEQVKRERDMAVEDINLIQSNEVFSCEICKYNHNGCYKRCDIGNRCFEWRGVKEDAHGHEA